VTAGNRLMLGQLDVSEQLAWTTAYMGE
jgi:hypothetical protein